ncbi:MAG TPA: DNA recombination protein RmuC [Solirubrobacteraceae bacterium]|jgi:DNA recombination protein RmuC
MSAVLLIIGILVGALLGALAAARQASRSREQLRDELQSVSADSRERMRDEMKAISADVLKQTGDSLAQRLAEQRRAEEDRIAGEMKARTEQIKGLMGPVSEKLGKVEGEISRLERERRQAQGELANMVRQLHEGVGNLRQETGNLVSALKRPSTRGSWGEIQLRNVIEMAGMVEHCDFLEQSTVRSDEGAALRPDVLVKLPGGKVIVVDSKVPLDAYLAHLEAQDDEARSTQLARHARQTRDHITKLASKGYQRQFDATPDLVVMFVPSDGIYQAALANDPSLIEYGVHQQVLMATPTTLIGLLRAVHYGWRQEQIAESARKIAETGRELHKRLATFAEPFAKAGRQLGSAVDAYNQAARSFDARLAPKVRELADLGASSGRESPAPTMIEASAHPPLAELADVTVEPTDTGAEFANAGAEFANADADFADADADFADADAGFADADAGFEPQALSIADDRSLRP